MIPTDMILDPSLRSKAEEILEKTRQDIANMEMEEIQGIIHVLQLRQIELTVQNQALQAAQSEAEMVHERYLKFFDLAPVGYLFLDEDERIKEANIMAATLLGGAQDTLKGKKLSSFIKEDSQDTYHCHFRRVFRSTDPQNCALRLANKDSLHVWVTSRTINAPDPMCLTTLNISPESPETL